MHLYSWHPVWLAALMVAGYIYIRIEGSRIMEKIRFFSGLTLVYGALGTPLSSFAFHGMITALIFQLSVLFFVVPPLLIRGFPLKRIRPLLRKNGIKKTFSVITYPWFTAILFNFGFSIFLFPYFFNWLHGHALAFDFSEGFLFLAALSMWWSILSPLPELNPLTQLKRLFYIFITAVMLTPIAFLMLFTKQGLYPAYAVTPSVFPYLNAIYDQQIAGGLLKAFQLSAYSVELIIIIYEWVRKEKETGNDSKSNKVVPIKRAD